MYCIASMAFMPGEQLLDKQMIHTIKDVIYCTCIAAMAFIPGAQVRGERIMTSATDVVSSSGPLACRNEGTILDTKIGMSRWRSCRHVNEIAECA